MPVCIERSKRSRLRGLSVAELDLGPTPTKSKAQSKDIQVRKKPNIFKRFNPFSQTNYKLG